MVGDVDSGEASLDSDHAEPEVVVAGDGEVALNGGWSAALVNGAVRLPRGDGSGGWVVTSGEAVGLYLQAGTGSACFVDFVSEVVELPGDDLHDARDFLAGFGA